MGNFWVKILTSYSIFIRKELYMKISEIFQEVLNEAVSRGVLYHFTGGKGFSVNVKNHGFKFHNMEMEYYEEPIASNDDDLPF